MPYAAKKLLRAPFMSRSIRTPQLEQTSTELAPSPAFQRPQCAQVLDVPGSQSYRVKFPFLNLGRPKSGSDGQTWTEGGQAD